MTLEHKQLKLNTFAQSSAARFQRNLNPRSIGFTTSDLPLDRQTVGQKEGDLEFFSNCVLR